MTIVELAQSLREALRKLFGSRLAEVMQTEILRLQMENQQLRQDYQSTIAELRSEKAQLAAAVALYQVNINQRVGIDPTRKRPEKPSFVNFNSPPAMSSWQKEVAEHDAQIEKELAAEAAAAKV
jgi:hypothetical protein